MRKILTSLILAGTLGVVGCGIKPENFVEGRVLSEYGNISRIEESSGALFGNESVKLGNPNYGLRVETPQGIYTIEVDVDDMSGSSGSHTAYNLAATIEIGTKIRFPLRLKRRISGEELFNSDRLGIVDPDDIEIIH